jgi:hypothetical protein
MSGHTYSLLSQYCNHVWVTFVVPGVCPVQRRPEELPGNSDFMVSAGGPENPIEILDNRKCQRLFDGLSARPEAI